MNQKEEQNAAKHWFSRDETPVFPLFPSSFDSTPFVSFRCYRFESKMMKGLYVFCRCDSYPSSNTMRKEYTDNDNRNRHNKQEREHTLAANGKGVELHLVNASFIGK